MSNPTFRALCAELLTAIQLYTQLNPAGSKMSAFDLTAKLMDAMAATNAALAQPEPQGPTDEKLTLVYAYAVAAAVDNKRGPLKPEDVEAAQLAGLRAVLALCGTPANTTGEENSDG